MKTILYMQNYPIASPDRRAEVDRCIRNNQSLGFDEFVEFDCGASSGGERPAVKRIRLNRRLNFRDYLREVALPENHGALHVLCNSDISLNESIFKLVDRLQPNELVCLSRYERSESGPVLTENPYCSQDTWAMIGRDLPESLIVQASFPLGWPGCENRFADLMGGYAYSQINPSKDVISIHFHAEHRGLDESSRLYGGYAFVWPCAFDDAADRPCVQYAYLPVGAAIRPTFRVQV
jgi:hypothetical protein